MSLPNPLASAFVVATACTAASALAPRAAHAEVPHVTLAEPQTRDNALSVGLGVGWVQGMNITYERSITGPVAIRVGYAAAVLPVFVFDIDLWGTDDGASDEAYGTGGDYYTLGHGPLLDLVLQTEGEHALEVSMGATLLLDWVDGPVPVPNGFIGYRYQPLDASLLVRAGAGLNGALAGGLVASVGTRF